MDQDIVSLSAILLDDAYFEALQAAKRQVDGVKIVDETLLIPFKARAVLDLTARSEKGANVHRKDIRKHRNDVFRLAQLLPEDARVSLPEPDSPGSSRFRRPGSRRPNSRSQGI